MHIYSRKTVAALVTSCLLIIASSASAASSATEQAKKQFKTAQKAYEAEDFQAALSAFEKAYALRPLPGFLFNMAQCHTHLKSHDEAKRLYEKYLSQRPKAPNRAIVETLIAEAKAAIATKQKTKAAALAPPPPPPPSQPQKAIAKAPVKTKPLAKNAKLATKPELKKPSASQLAPKTKELPPELELELVPLVPKAPALQSPPKTEPQLDPVMTAPLPTVDINAVMNQDTFYKRWWFWSLAGSVVAASVGAIVYANYSPEEVVVLPSGSLGRSDQR